uniref:Uncharacterized protein n=1 Tax=Setaria italica TaxID=4555 RepID=K3ZY66_SETIT
MKCCRLCRGTGGSCPIFKRLVTTLLGSLRRFMGRVFSINFPAIKALNEQIDTLPLYPLKIVNNVALLSKENTAVLNQRMHDLLLKVIPFQYPHKVKSATAAQLRVIHRKDRPCHFQW